MNETDLMKDSVGLDVPVARLRPLRDRKITKREHDRIIASIKTVGLIEPLVIFPEGADYVITDGAQCYRALVELGVGVIQPSVRALPATACGAVNWETVARVSMR